MNIKSRVVTVITTVALSGVAAVVPLAAVADHSTAHTIEQLTAQIVALQAQLAALSAGQAAVPAAGKCSFTRALTVGVRGDDVKCLQQYLTGTGHYSYSGGATGFFGGITRAAVAAWQAANGVSPAAGYFGSISRAKYDSLVAGAPAAPATPVAPGAPAVVVAAGSGLTVTPGVQAESQLAPKSAARIPMVKLVLTASSDGDATVKNIVVERQGLGDNAAFDGVILIDEDGTQIGNAKTFGSDNKATLTDGLVVKAGTSKNVTIGANMASSLTDQAGQTPRFAVLSIDAGSTKVNGSFPITGNSVTVNNTLTIGAVTMSIGSLDPGAANTKTVGTKGYYFASIKASVGSAEDVTFDQVRFNQAGSAASGDLKNVVVKTGDKDYPATISSDGKYYVAKFEGGLVIEKGKTLEFSVKGDLADGSARTVDFNVLRKTDIVVRGNTFKYAIVVGGGSAGAAAAGAFSSNQEPFFNAYAATIDKGSVNVSSSNKFPSGNVAVDVADVTLGAFVLDVKGEPLQVSSFKINFTFTGTGSSGNITNMKLVREDTGGIVAGPKDPSGGVVTWTDTWTAGVGEKHYLVKGKLSTTFVSNDTVLLSTDPDDNLTVKGEVTGLSVTPAPTTRVTSNTQTVKAGALALSVSPTPFAQNVVRGVNGYLFATYNFDAGASGEDVRVTSIELRDTVDAAGSGNEVNTCQLFDGATALNTGSDIKDPSDPTGTTNDVSFTLTNNLVIPKGAIKKIDLKCNISSNAADASTHQWGLNNATAANVVGAITGGAIVESITANAGSLMTVRTAGTFTVTKDASAPAAGLVVGGKADVPVNVLRFAATREAISITEVVLNFSTSTASSSDFLKATLWDGATKIGEAVFTGNDNRASKATSTLTSAFVIPKDGDRLMTVKADFATPGVVASTTAGRRLAVDYDGVSSSTGTGQSSGSRLGSGSSGDTAGALFQIVKSIPTVEKVAVPSTSIPQTNAVLYRFKVSADASGPVALYKFTFTIGSSSKSATTTNMNIYGYADSGFSVKAYDNNPLHPNNNECVGQSNLTNHPSTCTLAEGVGGNQKPMFTSASSTIASVGSAGTGDAIFFFAPVANNASSTEAIVVPAGLTRYFELRGDIALKTSGDTGNSISVYLKGDDAILARSAQGTPIDGGDVDTAGTQEVVREPTTSAASTCSGFTCANYGSLAYHDGGRGRFGTAVLAASRDDGGGNNFIWSPMSTSTSLTGATSTTDWTNGFLVPGLPQTGLSPNTFSN